MLDGIDRGDAEHEADTAVRRRAAPLAENAAPSALRDDRMDGQEIGRIAQLIDQPQLVRDLLAIGLGQTIGKHLGGSFAR